MIFILIAGAIRISEDLSRFYAVDVRRKVSGKAIFLNRAFRLVWRRIVGVGV